VCYVAVCKMLGNIQHAYFADPAHEMHQYSLMMAPLRAEACRIVTVNKVVLTYTVYWSDLYVKTLSPVHGYGGKIMKKCHLNDYSGNVGSKVYY
jgi:hypothetical protein